MAALAIPLIASMAAGTAATAMGVAASATFMGMTAAGWGWALGSMAASYMLAPDSEGPRLSDLAAGGSSYGVPIPLCYGTTKLGGNVIWASDLIETENTESAKGGPEYTSYSYSQHLAVMVCAGPVTGIRKIWANGGLIMDASATNTGATGQTSNIRIYAGDETQIADSLLESHIGVGLVPAHRGYCYVVFDGLQLEDYGNRTPSFEFEVVSVGDLARPAYDSLFTESWFTMSGGSAVYDAYANLIHYQDTYSVVNLFDIDRREWMGSYNLPMNTWRIFPGPGTTIYGMGQYNMYKMDSLSGETLETWAGNVSVTGAYRPYDFTFISVEDATIYRLKDGAGAVETIAVFPGVLWQSLVIAGEYVVLYSDYSKRIGVLNWANTIVLDYSIGTPPGSTSWIDTGTYDSTRNRVHFVASDKYTIWTVNLDDLTVTSTYVTGSGSLYKPTYMSSTDLLVVGDNYVSAPTVSQIDPDTITLIDEYSLPSNKQGRIHEYTRSPDKSLLLDDGPSYTYNAGFVSLHDRITPSQVALSSIVADLCERAGLEATDYDVTGLTDMVDGYKTT